MEVAKFQVLMKLVYGRGEPYAHTYGKDTVKGGLFRLQTLGSYPKLLKLKNPMDLGWSMRCSFQPASKIQSRSDASERKGRQQTRDDTIQKGVTEAIQKQQGEIDALRDLLKRQMDSGPLDWELPVNTINVCDLTKVGSFTSRVINSPTMCLAAQGLVSNTLCVMGKVGVKKSLLIGAVVGLGLWTYTRFIAPTPTKRCLMYNITREEVYRPPRLDGEEAPDPRPSYDQARDHVIGHLYHGQPFIRTWMSDGSASDSYTLDIFDPDHDKLVELDIFTQAKWYKASPVVQSVDSAMTQEILTRRTLPEKAHIRVRRVLATHDRLCGNTISLLRSGRSDYRDTSQMCELIIARTPYLNGQSSNVGTFMATGQVILAFSLVTCQLSLSLGCQYLIREIALRYLAPSLLLLYRGMSKGLSYLSQIHSVL